MREKIQVTAAVVLVLAVGLACKPRRKHVTDDPPTPVTADTASSSTSDDDDDKPVATSTSTAKPKATATATATATTTTTHAPAATHVAAPQTEHKDPPCYGDFPRICNGVCVHLATDDNNCGSCGTRCPAGKHCDGHLFCRDAEGNL
jgi:hypothetical protein